jgi:hypothetical protein
MADFISSFTSLRDSIGALKPSSNYEGDTSKEYASLKSKFKVIPWFCSNNNRKVFSSHPAAFAN